MGNRYNAVDWEEMVGGYNRIKGEGFLSAKGLLEHLYTELNNLRKMEELLGVSWAAISAKMDKENIPRRHVKKDGPKTDAITKIPDETLKEMDCKAVAEFVGCTINWAIVCLRRQGRSYKKHRRYANGE